MFHKHRTGGWIWTSIGSAFAVRIATAAAASSSNSIDSPTTGSTVTGIALFGGVPAGIGIGKLVRFSTTREAEILSAFEQGKTLPKYVSSRLKRKYFGK
ncbi:hypothetical protein AM218_11530 [Hymenobacter sp. DG25A]|nr:hypothetical protein AM218_11530 [Hymenobacter sp. DG25A]